MSPEAHRRWPERALILFLLAGFAVRALYALPDPDPRRFWDERVGIWNTESLVGRGELRPANGFYPSLSYLPHAALVALAELGHRVSGAEALRMLDRETEFGLTGNAVLLARFVSVAAGTLTLWLVFLLGRRLASPLVGLLAAAILSASWTHLFVSIKFKPDVLAVLFAVVAFLWLLDALERPTLGRWAVAGVGVGLAASSKFLGAAMGVPLVVAALRDDAPELRRRANAWRRIVLAGAAAVATFLALNPWLGVIVRDLSRTRRDYAEKAERAAATSWSLLGEATGWLVQDHRPVVALFVALGFVGLAWRAVRGRPAADAPAAEGRARGPSAAQAAAVLAAILGHSLFYALATPHFRSWNYLPVVPFTAFAGAWAMVTGGQAATARLGSRARRSARAALGIVVAALFLAVPVGWLHAATVPSTWEVAARALGRHPVAPAVVVYGAGVRDPVERAELRPRFAFLEVDRLAEVEPARLARADAVVVPAGPLDETDEAIVQRLLREPGRSLTRVEPRWGRSRGRALRVIRSPWRPLGEGKGGALERSDGAFVLPLERPLAPGETVSVVLEVQRTGRRGRFPRALRVRGIGEAELYRYRRGERAWLTTSKLRVKRPLDRLVIEIPGLRRQIAVEGATLHRWRRGEAAGAREP